MINYTWTILQMWVKPTNGSYTDVVINARWNCMASQEVNGVPYAVNLANNCSFPMPEGQFTPYADLTQEQVLGWCWANGVNQPEVEGIAAAQLAAAINPPVIEPQLPWAPPPQPNATQA